MAFGAKYRALLSGRTDDWTIDIEKDGGSGATSFDVEGFPKITWGNPGGTGFGAAVYPSYVRLRLLDTSSNAIWADLKAASEKQYRVKIYNDGGDFIWYGWLVKDTMQRRLSTTTRAPLVDIYAACGLGTALGGPASSPNVDDATTGYTSLHSFFSKILYDDNQALNIFYGMSWHPSNMSTTAQTTPENVGVSQFFANVANAEFFIQQNPFRLGPGAIFLPPSLRSSRNRGVSGFQGNGQWVRATGGLMQLQSLSDMFGLRCYESSTGIWRVEQEHVLGEAVGTSYNSTYLYNGTTVTAQATTTNEVTLTDDDLDSNLIIAYLESPTGVVVRRTPPNVDAANIARDAGFEQLQSTSTAVFPNTNLDYTYYWSEFNGGLSSHPSFSSSIKNSGTYSCKLTGNGDVGIWQDMAHYSAAEKVGLRLRFWCNFENNSGGDSTITGRYAIYYRYGASFASLQYWNASTPAWQSAQIFNSFTSSVSVTSGGGTSGWESQDVTTATMANDGIVGIIIKAPVNASYAIYVDDIICEIALGTDNSVHSWASYFDATGTGETPELERNIANLNNARVMTITQHGPAVYKQVTGWSPVEPSETGDFWDLARLQAEDRIDRHNDEAEILVGTFHGILRPEQQFVYGSNTYIMGDGLEVDLRRGTTYGSLRQKQKTGQW